MAVAAWVHLPNGWVHTSTGGGWEYPVFLIAASIALWLLGDGAAAIKRSALLVPRFRAARFGKSPFEPSTAKEISRSSTTLSNLGRVSLRPRVRDALRAEGLVK
jgi:hypothetical protein